MLSAGLTPKLKHKGKSGMRSAVTYESMAKELHDLLDMPPGHGYKKGRQIIGAIINSMVEALRRGETVEIQGFGTFRVRDFRGYTIPVFAMDGKHVEGPKPKVMAHIKARKYVHFSPARSWTAMINVTRGFPLSFYERRSFKYWKPKE